jgi:Lar family restriction alleviation protein
MTSDERVELLPCPFCGGVDLYWPHGTDPAVIKCGGKNGCGAESGVQDGEDGEQTEALAVAVWNRRAALAAAGSVPKEVVEAVKKARAILMALDDMSGYSQPEIEEGINALELVLSSSSCGEKP